MTKCIYYILYAHGFTIKLVWHSFVGILHLMEFILLMVVTFQDLLHITSAQAMSG